jgi:hypothetical protein
LLKECCCKGSWLIAITFHRSHKSYPLGSCTFSEVVPAVDEWVGGCGFGCGVCGVCGGWGVRGDAAIGAGTDSR